MSSSLYANASGTNARYTIVRYVDGVASPTTPVIGPTNDGGAAHVAWPSAFRVPVPMTRIYASRYTGTLWQDIAMWEGPSETALNYLGVALAANASEPHGIGPAQAFHVPGDAKPWKLAYLVRGSGTTNVGSAIWIAESANGAPGNWQRVGAALTASESWEAAGIVPSFIFFEPSIARWVMLYHAYETLGRAHAAMATAVQPHGPYGNKALLMSPIESRIAITAGAKLTHHAQAASAPRLGEPYVLRQATPSAMEVAVPVDYRDGVVYFDRPLIGDYPSGEMAHVASAKVDPSFVEQLPDGSWRGIWTGYGQHPVSALSEYTFEVRAPALTGPWAPSGTGIALQPWTAAGVFSTENPTPVISIS